MQIKIEIDVKPDELRRFLGLPDVAGLQDDVVQFLRTKVGQVNESFNPADFVKGNIDTLKQSTAWRRLRARLLETEAEAAAEEPTPAKKPRKRPARKSSSSGKAAKGTK